MIFTLEEMRERLQINKHLIDDELEIQPSLSFHAGQEAAKAREEKDNARIRIDIIRDHVAHELRKKNDKISEARLTRECEAHPEVVDMKRAYNKASRKSAELDHLVSAIAQRSHSLSGLSNLYVHNYYSKDSVSVGRSERRTGRSASDYIEKDPPEKRMLPRNF